MTVRIFDLDFGEIFDNAVSIYQDMTGYTLGRQDAERLMIQIFAGMVHKWGTAWLQAIVDRIEARVFALLTRFQTE